jgi:hypothetical protein
MHNHRNSTSAGEDFGCLRLPAQDSSMICVASFVLLCLAFVSGAIQLALY